MLIVFFMAAAIQPAQAVPAGVTYYVSSSGGSDSFNGLSTGAPFKTVGKVNNLNLQPGDKVLFKCGDTWRGEMLTISKSGTAGQPITFGSYPEGCINKPILSGTQPVSGWVSDGGNVYRANLASGANAGKFNGGINQLFRGGARLLLGRWPNLGNPDGGYSTIDSHPNEWQVVDNELPSGSWSGAVMHMKSIRWSILNRQVTGGSGTTLVVGSTSDYGTRLNCWADGGSCVGWGYFINNHRNTLDQDGEWYFDGSTVYLYSSSGKPDDNEVEGSVMYKTGDSAWRAWGGINLTPDYGTPIAYVTVENLNIWGWFRDGIAIPTNMHPSEVHDLVIRNNTIADVDNSGISLATWVWDAGDGRPDGWRGGYNLTVTGNTIERANHMGIDLYSRNSTFSNNIVRDIALIENLGAAGMGCGFNEGDASGGVCTEDGDGIRIKIDQANDTGNSNTFSGNRLEHIGYSGFDVFGYGNTFEKNVIIEACIAKGDCGGVRTFGRDSLGASAVHDLTFNQNIIVDTTGNTDGCQADFDSLFGFGFYIDNYSRSININGNTVINSTAHGILFQNSTGSATNNTLYNNGNNSDYSAAQLYITNGGGDPSYVNLNTGNIFFGLIPQAMTMDIGSTGRLGTSNNNYFFQPYHANHISAGSDYTLAAWRSASGKDGSSKEHWYTQPSGEAPKSVVFYNDTAQNKVVDLGYTLYKDLDQNPVSGSITLAPYASRVLVKVGYTADLAVTMAVLAGGDPAAGAPVTYTITLKNQGGLAASDITLTNSIPAQIEKTTWSAEGGSPVLQGGAPYPYTWQIASLANGSSLTITVSGTYVGSLPAGAMFSITADASMAAAEVDEGNNHAALFLGDWLRLYFPLVVQ